MTEGRVAQIVCQTGCRNDGSNLSEQGVGEFGVASDELVRHVVAQGTAYAGHLERVGEAVVHEDTSRKWEHLRLVLQPAEGSREDEPVVIALEFASVVVTLGVSFLLSEPFVGYQLLPVHKYKTMSSFLVRNH